MAESKAEASTRLKSGGFLPAWDTKNARPRDYWDRLLTRMEPTNVNFKSPEKEAPRQCKAQQLRDTAPKIC